MIKIGENLVDGLDVLDLLEVARVGAGPQDQADATPLVSPSTRHKAARRVVQNGTDFDFDIT